MDKIIIKDLRVTGILGIYEHERTIPQEILINIIMETDSRKAALSDDISDCVDYEIVANKIKTHTQNSKRMTVEALAEDLAGLCLLTPGVRRVRIRVEKTRAISFTTSVGIEIERDNLTHP